MNNKHSIAHSIAAPGTTSLEADQRNSAALLHHRATTVVSPRFYPLGFPHCTEEQLRFMQPKHVTAISAATALDGNGSFEQHLHQHSSLQEHSADIRRHHHGSRVSLSPGDHAMGDHHCQLEHRHTQHLVPRTELHLTPDVSRVLLRPFYPSCDDLAAKIVARCLDSSSGLRNDEADLSVCFHGFHRDHRRRLITRANEVLRRVFDHCHAVQSAVTSDDVECGSRESTPLQFRELSPQEDVDRLPTLQELQHLAHVIDNCAVNDASSVDAESLRTVLTIGSAFVQEYAVEACGSFNPSIVPLTQLSSTPPPPASRTSMAISANDDIEHPTPRRCESIQKEDLLDEERSSATSSTTNVHFTLFSRGVGEGHVSSVGCRDGVLSVTSRPSSSCQQQRHCPSWISVDLHVNATATSPPSHGVQEPASFSDVQQDQLDEDDVHEFAQALLEEEELRQCQCNGDLLPFVVEARRRLVDSSKLAAFDPSVPFSQRVVFPFMGIHGHGIEDVRFTPTHFKEGEEEADSSRASLPVYFGTCTAYSGHSTAIQLIKAVGNNSFARPPTAADAAAHPCHADDDHHPRFHDPFTKFIFSQITGPHVENKGFALFPRKINGRYWMLTRNDDANILIMSSPSKHHWPEKPRLLSKCSSWWEVIKLGNCGSPLLTKEGWLVITHGVGLNRTYRLGALLLDRYDPTRVIGRLREPLLSPSNDATHRHGLVPNVLYSCGAMIIDDGADCTDDSPPTATSLETRTSSSSSLLFLPYAECDQRIRFATMPLGPLLEELVRCGE